MPDELNESGLPMIVAAGQAYSLGCLPPDGIERHPKFGAYYDAIPQTQWQELSCKHFNIPILHQGRTNSCTGQATTGAALNNRARARWRSVALNPYAVYAIINGGRDEGATIGQVLDAGRKYGIGSLEAFPQAKVLYRNQLTRAQLQNMKKYRITEAYKIDNFEQLGTALTLGFDVVFGIAVGNNFDALSSEAIPPLPDRVRGGHALRACGLKRSKQYNAWVLETPNSWGTGWGDKGYCYIRAEHFDPRYGFGFDAFALMYTNTNTEDVDLPNVFGSAASLSEVIDNPTVFDLSIMPSQFTESVDTMNPELDPILKDFVDAYVMRTQALGAQIVEGQQVDGFNDPIGGNILVDLVIKKLLPSLLEKYGDEFVDQLMDYVGTQIKAYLRTLKNQ